MVITDQTDISDGDQTMNHLDPAKLHRPSIQGHAQRTTHLRGFLLGRGFYKAAVAMDYAAGFHAGFRKDGVTPEFAHQVYIVSYLSTLLPHLRHPEETLAVGFLHDLVEDYGVGLAASVGRENNVPTPTGWPSAGAKNRRLQGGSLPDR